MHVPDRDKWESQTNGVLAGQFRTSRVQIPDDVRQPAGCSLREWRTSRTCIVMLRHVTSGPERDGRRVAAAQGTHSVDAQTLRAGSWRTCACQPTSGCCTTAPAACWDAS